MSNWLLKSTVQRAISLFPYSSEVNELFQRYVTRSVELGDGMFQTQLERSHTHLNHFLARQKEKPVDFTVLEVGTGWYPTQLLGLYLCGSKTIWTYDIASHLRRSRIQRMVQLFSEYDRQNKIQQHLPLVRPERLAFFRQNAPFANTDSPEQFLARFNILARLQNVEKSGLDAGSVDLSFSHAVLQHIPPAVLKKIVVELRRVASARSATSHSINLADLFATSDPSITPFNCLKFSEQSWRYLNSPLIPQHRLRIADYRQIFTEAGFKVEKEDNVCGSVEDLKRIRLAPEFQKYSQEDLLVISSWLVAIPA